MGESGSLVQPAGSAAFLSWGSSRGNRNVPRREQRHKPSKRKGKKQQEKECLTFHCSRVEMLTQIL